MAEQLPENLGELELDELQAHLDARLADYDSLAEIADDDLTDEQLAALEALVAEIESIQGEQGAREAAAADRAARAAAARAKVTAAAPAAEDETEPEVEADEAEVEVPDTAAELVEEEEQEAVVASARKPIVKRAASRLPQPEVPVVEEEKTKVFNIVAATEVRGFAAGQELKSLDELTQAFQARTSSFREGHGNKSFTNSYPVAQINRNMPEEYTVGKSASDSDAREVFSKASKAFALGQDSDALVASGGWAAPSEIKYDIPILETVDGLFSLPTVQVNRGGFQYTKGIDFSTIYGDSNVFFNQTETQAQAQTVKPFLTITDPTFQEVRLEVIGHGLRAGILTNHAWPELVNRFVSGSMTAFAHKRNAYIINKVVGFLGSAVTADTYGSVFNDSLDAIERHVQQLRYKYRLSHSQTFDGIAPYWLLSVLRQDLAHRTFVDYTAVTDAQIQSWLTSRGVRLQWVYDWQDLPGDTTDFPTTAQIGLWFPGAFVVGGGPVISLDALYDYDGISKNTYTVAFAEESILVANMVAGGRLITIGTAAAKRIGATGGQTIAHA